MLVAGVGPVPPEAGDRLFAPGIRVWGIARELALAGHAVRLATVQFSGAPIDRMRVSDLNVANGSVELSNAEEVKAPGGDLAKALEAQISAFRLAALVGCTDLINRELARVQTELPLWCDYFGDPMAERQMLAQLHQSDAALADQWRTLAPALVRGDRFSGCSRYQAGAIHGELAAVGRLNSHTACETLVSVIPPWIEPIAPSDEAGPFLRGPVVPDDAVIAIHTGGFNTWVDVETLFAALELAMARHPQLHYATTGGIIPGHNEHSFGKFQELARGSAHARRYHFLGWLPLGRVPRVIAEADFGLNVDRVCAEGWLGTRNRPMDWLLAGKPVVSTIGCELVEELADKGYVIGARQGDPADIADAIDRFMSDRHHAVAAAASGRDYLLEHHAPARCLRPLLDWARDPNPASDLRLWRAGQATPPELWRRACAGAIEAAEIEREREESARLRARMNAMEGSRLVRAALWLRDRRRTE